MYERSRLDAIYPLSTINVRDVTVSSFLIFHKSLMRNRLQCDYDCSETSIAQRFVAEVKNSISNLIQTSYDTAANVVTGERSSLPVNHAFWTSSSAGK